MKNFFKNYKMTLILLISIILGAVIGIIFKEDAAVLSPFGDLFLNLLFVVIVPLLFLTITTSIAKMKQPKRLSKIMRSIVIVFIIASLVSVFVGLISTSMVKLVNPDDSKAIQEAMMSDEEAEEVELNILDRTVQLISVNDFNGLLTKDNVIAIVIFAIVFGIAMRKADEKAEPLLNVLVSANEVILKVINIIMYYAPIGICCYFASLVGTFGSTIAVGFVKTFVLYLVVAILFYFIVYTIYAYIAGGKRGVVVFWKNVIPTTATSLATCSSAACIPVNVESVKKMGVSDDIAETIVPLGTSFHKDGTIIGSVFKIMFLVCLFGNTFSVGTIIVVALIANLLITAVPIGGGTISEMMIISMLGFPVAALPILTMIATIIDAPATMLNVVGDTSSSMLVSRMVDGKDWMKEETFDKKKNKKNK